MTIWHFINEELQSLKTKLAEKLSEDTLSEEKHNKLLQVSGVLDDYKNHVLDEKMGKKLFYIQDLMEEI